MFLTQPIMSKVYVEVLVRGDGLPFYSNRLPHGFGLSGNQLQNFSGVTMGDLVDLLEEKAQRYPGKEIYFLVEYIRG